MKKRIAEIMLITSGLLIVVVLIYGIVHGHNRPDEAGEGSFFTEDNTVYHLDEHDLAEFSEVIVEQFYKESRFVVYSVDTSVSVDLKQTGLFDLDLLNKTQKVIYRGSGSYYVDFGVLGKHSIRLDNSRSTVTIEIPHTKLEEIEIDPLKFSFEEAQKGFLAFGELKFTAEEYNNLEKECKNRIRKTLDTKEYYKAADDRAVEEMIKIYEPIVQAVDSNYHVEIVFLEPAA